MTDQDPLRSARLRNQGADTRARVEEQEKQRLIEERDALVRRMLASAVDELLAAGRPPRRLLTHETFYGKNFRGKTKLKRRPLAGEGWVIDVRPGWGSEPDSGYTHLVLTPAGRLMSTRSPDTWKEGGGLAEGGRWSPEKTPEKLAEFLARELDEIKAGRGWDPGGQITDLSSDAADIEDRRFLDEQRRRASRS